MNVILHILRFKNLMFWKVSSNQSAGTIIRNIGSSLVFILFGIGAFYFSNFITAYLLNDVKIGLFLFHRFVGMLLFVFFVMINLGNMVVSFSTLYRSPEVNFLLSTPVSYLNIFIIKFLDNFFYSSGTLFMAGFAVLLGYGYYFHYPWHFYPVIMLGVLVPFMFLAGCVAVIILLLVMNLASKINFKVLTGIVVALYLTQAYIYFKVTSPVHLVQEVLKYYPYVDLYFGSLDPTAAKVLPNFWVSEILYFYAKENFTTVAKYIALLNLTTAGAFAFLLAAGNALFYPTWITSLSIKALGMKKIELKSSFFTFGKKSFFSPQSEVLLKKEYWQFLREPSQWIHLIVMMVLVVIFLSSVSTLDIKLESPELRSVVYLVIFVFNIFLINSIALRFCFPMISLEGNAYWSIRSAPISVAKVYWIKFILSTIFLLILGGAIAFFSNIPNLFTKTVEGQLPWQIIYITPHRALQKLAYTSIGITMCAAIGLVSLNFGMGALYANFNEKNPIRIASSQGATITFLLSVVYLVLLLAVYFYPVVTMYKAALKVTLLNYGILVYVFTGVLLFTGFMVTISHVIGLKSLKRDF